MELPDEFLTNEENDSIITQPIESPIKNVQDEKPEEHPNNTDFNVLEEYLKRHGIDDISKLQFQDDSGETTEVDFNTLTPEEQLEILTEVSNPGLSEDEVNAIDYLRRNRVTLEQAIEYFKQKAIEDYIAQNGDQTKYDIDDYSDDEIYIADLRFKFPTLTDEELSYKLEQAKQNEELFKKEIDSIKESYKENVKLAQEEAEQEAKTQQEEFKNSLITASQNFNEISLDYKDPDSDSLVIEPDDKQKVLSYILDQDTNGYSKFGKDLMDPKILFELAWYRLYGKDVISNISSYFKDIIKNERKSNKKTNVTSKPEVIIDNTKSDKASDMNSIYDRVNFLT